MRKRSESLAMIAGLLPGAWLDERREAELARGLEHALDFAAAAVDATAPVAGHHRGVPGHVGVAVSCSPSVVRRDPIAVSDQPAVDDITTTQSPPGLGPPLPTPRPLEVHSVGREAVAAEGRVPSRPQ